MDTSALSEQPHQTCAFQGHRAVLQDFSTDALNDTLVFCSVAAVGSEVHIHAAVVNIARQNIRYLIEDAPGLQYFRHFSL